MRGFTAITNGCIKDIDNDLIATASNEQLHKERSPLDIYIFFPVKGTVSIDICGITLNHHCTHFVVVIISKWYRK